MIRKVNESFIPVSARAAAVNGPPGTPSEEGSLLRAIGRSAPAPQGLCILNSDGRPLSWALMFQSDERVLEFLDRGVDRFARLRDATTPWMTERYQEYPSRKLPDVSPPDPPAGLPRRHAIGSACPGEKPGGAGDGIRASVVGRALDQMGRPVEDVTRQEHYVEDEFDVPLHLERALIDAIERSSTGDARLPEELARRIITHAYLGFLDVRPYENPRRCPSDLKECAFRIERAGDEPGLYLVTGRTDVRNSLERMGPGDRHDVTLEWRGFVEIENGRMTRLLLEGEGTEVLQYGLTRHPLGAPGKTPSEVTALPAGHPIDLDARVRFGIIARRDVAAGR